MGSQLSELENSKSVLTIRQGNRPRFEPRSENYSPSDGDVGDIFWEPSQGNLVPHDGPISCAYPRSPERVNFQSPALVLLHEIAHANQYIPGGSAADEMQALSVETMIAERTADPVRSVHEGYPWYAPTVDRNHVSFGQATFVSISWGYFW